MNRNALNAYAQISVDGSVATASPHRLITMLFEGALLSIATARGHMQRNEIAAKGAAISKAIAIIDEGLKLSLDMKAGGDLAQKLDALYEYMCLRLLFANLKNDLEPLDEISSLLNDLKSAWVEIDPEKAKAIQISQSTPL
ncbi:MAG: flagellar export chaperone FliS [Proteobacteria bacterium]|nr:flagellar export chaperone FliS [Pseudomonadota bacterium]